MFVVRWVSSGYGKQEGKPLLDLLVEVLSRRGDMSLAAFRSKREAVAVSRRLHMTIALVVEGDTHFSRRWAADAGTSPSPLGLISAEKPGRRSRPEGALYEEWTASRPSFRGWTTFGQVSPEEFSQIREEMSKWGLKYIDLGISAPK